MWMYFFKRLMHGIPVLLTVATLTFGIMHLVPGGPFDQEKKLPPEIIANIEAIVMNKGLADMDRSERIPAMNLPVGLGDAGLEPGQAHAEPSHDPSGCD